MADMMEVALMALYGHANNAAYLAHPCQNDGVTWAEIASYPASLRAEDLTSLRAE